MEYDALYRAVKLYKREVLAWLQEQQYVPAMERRCEKYTIQPPSIEHSVLKTVYQKLLSEKREMIPDFANDFGQELVKQLYDELENENRKLLLSWMK